MISPHARCRERGIFILNVDADRERRAKGLPEPDGESQRRRPGGPTMIQRLTAEITHAVHTKHLIGG